MYKRQTLRRGPGQPPARVLRAVSQPRESRIVVAIIPNIIIIVIMIISISIIIIIISSSSSSSIIGLGSSSTSSLNLPHWLSSLRQALGRNARYDSNDDNNNNNNNNSNY